MAGGYMGRLLFVDLSTGGLVDEALDEKLYRDYIGGYGVGARILYSRQRGGIDPLGPENILGLITGPLTGTPATFGSRFAFVAKSPLTGGWGDTNSGGEFGPFLKFSGYDGVFLSGISERPVYLLIDNGKAELRGASHLWGKDTFQTEDILKHKHGKEAKVVSIGPAGERMSLVSCLITQKGAAAGRSGLGAVMGSKRLKAIVVKGTQKVPVARMEEAKNLRKEHIARIPKPFLERFHQYGTGGHADTSAHSGDSPVKNWVGIGVIDLPDVSGLHKDRIIANVESRMGCWHCPLACRARLKEGPGEYPYPAGSRRPEYETLAAFGAMCLNNNAEAVAMANHLCDIYGLDTISTGTIIAFAMECYEHQLITKEDTGGIDLAWGDHQAMIAMIEKIARREGIGDILADGVKLAAVRIGKGAEQYAVHIGGQELGLHDPKGGFFGDKMTTAMYHMDATPGRHTTGFGSAQFPVYLLNAAGVCMHGNIGVRDADMYTMRFLNTVTGWERSVEELLEAGERIAIMRHVFNLREGLNPLDRKVHPRIIGRPPQKDGPLAGVSTDMEAQAYWNLGALDWDRITTKPSKKRLLKLGLHDLAEELWPPEPPPGPMFGS